MEHAYELLHEKQYQVYKNQRLHLKDLYFLYLQFYKQYLFQFDYLLEIVQVLLQAHK